MRVRYVKVRARVTEKGYVRKGVCAPERRGRGRKRQKREEVQCKGGGVDVSGFFVGVGFGECERERLINVYRVELLSTIARSIFNAHEKSKEEKCQKRCWEVMREWEMEGKGLREGEIQRK